MNVKEFLVSMPRLCKARNAERWSRLIELQYDDEISNPNSAFRRNSADMEEPANRIETAFGFYGDEDRITHCRILAEILILAHYVNEHKEPEWANRIAELVEAGKYYESIHQDIASAMSLEQASTLAGWNV